MDVLPQASLFIGVIPALFFLFISLKGYDGSYKEKYIFLTFVLGILAGFLGLIVEFFTYAIGFLFIIMYPITHHLIKTAILNLPRFHGKKDTTIYGLSLGLGYGAIFAPYMILTSNYTSGGNPMLLLFLIIIGTVGIILFHGATGVLIGYGVSTKKLPKMFIISVLLHLPITITLLIIAYNLEVSSIYNYLICLFIIYGLILYWYVTKEYLPYGIERKNRRKKTT